ncbi:uncharacterized protein LOC143249012 [Tachypleus tridentatus]|uniref:uncharacterized protein LOC143249012 n=1 Tax=Tachypleus tridentatus TaxID=6853 RepID=UPI003FD3490E
MFFLHTLTVNSYEIFINFPHFSAVKSGEQLTILLSTSAVDNVTCGSAVCDRSDSISPFSGESNPVEFPGALVHSAVQQLQGTQDSLRSTPVLFHDTEVWRFIRSEDVSHREQEDDELHQCKEIFSQVVQIIKDICNVANQTLLLQDLHESRMCNQLLVPEASEDIWKQGGFLSSGKVAHMYGHSMLGEDGI